MYNEEKRIGRRLAELDSLEGIDEVLVVDGGSSDKSCQVVEQFAFKKKNKHLLLCPKGRAKQMNHGAHNAKGDILLFLHADATLPETAPQQIRNALQKKDIVAGAFYIRTICDADYWHLAPLLRLADLRCRYSSLPYGDQGIFARRQDFLSLGGFAALPIFEDLDFCSRIQQKGKIKIIENEITVSGRRFVAHPIYATLLVNTLPLLYRLGISPRLLARLYHSTSP